MAAKPFVTALLRAAGKLPVPGTFPLLVDPLHKRIQRGATEGRRQFFGADMALNLEDYVERRIYYECYEPELVRFLEKVLRKGDVVVDVGANIGFVSVVAAAFVGEGGQVHSFEPIPGNLERLRKNTAHAPQVTIHPHALGDAPGELSLGTDDQEDGVTGFGGNFRVGGSSHQTPVAVETLDASLATVPKVRLMKMDVEGYEPRVLAGAKGFLKGETRPDYIVCEMNERQLALAGHSMANIARPISEAGYELFRLRSNGTLVSATSLLATFERRGKSVASARDLTLFEHAVRHLKGEPVLFTMVAVRRGIA